MSDFKLFRQRGKTPKSVDGFIPSVGGLSSGGRSVSDNPDLVNTDLNEIKKSTDGFNSYNTQSQLDAKLNNLPSLKAHTPKPEITKLAAEKVKKSKKRRLPKKVVLGSLLTIFIGGLMVGGYVFGRAWWNTHRILRGGSDGALALNSNVDPTQLNGEGDGRVNILLLGKGGDDHPGGDLTDSIMIASIDPINNEAVLLSIPRDLYVGVPDYWSMKINGVYASGKQRALSTNGDDVNAAEKAGVDLLDKVIETTIGIPIHYYVMIDFNAFKEAVDAVGGVDLNVPEPLYDYVQAWDNDFNPLIASAGQQHFDGKKALLYARSRSTSSDFARGERQRAVIIAIKDKVLQLGTFSNPITVSKLLDALGNNVTSSFSLSEMMRLYEISKDIPTQSITSVGFTDEPNILVKTASINGLSVVVPRAGNADFSEIQSFVRNQLRDGFLKSEDAKVAVLNGSGISGLAGQKANELKSYGYNVVAVDDAPTTDYTSTVLIDFSSGAKKYTVRYLEQRLKTAAVQASSGIDPTVYNNADIVVIVGTNENPNP